MIQILFSPSEGKNFTHTHTEMRLLGGLETRREILDAYNAIVLSENEELIKTLFGYKKFQECTPYICDIFSAPTTKAIQRYKGVAYEYLEYETLTEEAKKYVDTHTIIFSNLFGAIRADDLIPVYKVKQGNAIGEIKPEEFYEKRFSYQLDLYLGDSEILDLRAGYYDKFYKPSRPFTTLKFLKNGKVVSHWAKAYRGMVLREMAQHDIQTLDEFIKMPLQNLQIQEIRTQKNKTEIIYTIMDT